MNYFNRLDPGKRENAFYVQASIADTEILAERANGEKEYLYVWDAQKKCHKSILVDKSDFDILK